MKSIVKAWALAGILTFAAGEAKAGNVMTPSLSLFYFQDAAKRDVPGSTSQSTKSKTTYTFVNLGVCYNLEGLCLGLKYLQGEVENHTSGPGTNGSSIAKIHGPGLTVGYSNSDGLVAHLTYMLDTKKDIDGASTTYTCKTCYVAELGYGFKVSSIRVGPLLGLYQFSYDHKDVNGTRTALKPYEEDHYIMPQVALWFDL